MCIRDRKGTRAKNPTKNLVPLNIKGILYLRSKAIFSFLSYKPKIKLWFVLFISDNHLHLFCRFNGTIFLKILKIEQKIGLIIYIKFYAIIMLNK